MDGSSLFLTSWERLDIVLAHEVEKLSWDLVENLFGEKVRVVLELVEGNKLDDVGSHVLTESFGVESFFVSIKHLH